MADIKKIKVGDTTYNIKDATAVHIEGNETINGIKTFNAPTNTSGTEQATIKLKTANGGAIIFGKEGTNSGSMIRLDQVDGTCRLKFRSSSTAGAMVWEQPENGSTVYFDVTNMNFRGVTSMQFAGFKSAGYLYTDSNGSLKKGTLNLDNVSDGSTRKLANYIPKSLTSAKGDMIYASAASTPARLGIGSNGQFLSIANGIPTWVNNPNTDTKNTAGSTNDTSKLYLVGAKTQAANPQTYSNSKLYVEGDILTTETLKAGTIVTNNWDFHIEGSDHDIALFSSTPDGWTSENLSGHLIVSGDDDNSNSLKPTNNTGWDDLDTYYFNTGITLANVGGNTSHKLSFPAKSGTFALTSDIKSLASNTTASGGIKYITEASFTNGVLTLESKYLHLE